MADPSTLPKGYTLDAPSTLPPGYTLDAAPLRTADESEIREATKQLYTTPEGIPVYEKPAWKEPEGSAAKRIAKGIWETTGGPLLDMARVAGSSMGHLPVPGTPGFDAMTQFVMGHVDQAEKAKEAWKQGRYSEAFGHSLATVVPLLGPGAAAAAEKFGSEEKPQFDRYGNVVKQGQAPDIAGGIGQTAGLLGTTAVKPATEAYGAIDSAYQAGRAMGGLPPRPLIPTPDLPTPNLRILPEVNPAKSATAQQVIEQGRKYNVPLTAGDITQAPSLKNIEVSAEQVPGLGMRKFREGQQESIKTAAGGLKGQYEDALIGTDPSSITELQQSAEGGDERARNVLEKMNSAGNDPDRIIQASIGLGDWTTRQTATQLYDRVQELAEKNNLGDVPLDATGKAIGASLQQLRPAKLPNKEVIGLLGKIKESISPKLDAEGKPVVDAQGNPIGPNNTYGLIRQLHSDLGERIREYYQGNNALIGEKGVGYLERVQNALEDDMRNYAAQSGVPEIVEAGEKADSYYKTARVPYKNGMLASAATSTEPDQIFNQFIKAGKGDRASNFYAALDERGRAAVRYSMVGKAIEDATNPQSGIFSPQKFFTSVDKLESAYDVFFTAKDKAEIGGFKNLMKHVTRAGQYAENPPTGQRAIPIMLGMGALSMAEHAAAHPYLTGASAALFGMSRVLLTTAKGRQWLMRAYGVKPGSAMMNNIWEHVGQEMPRPPEEPPEGPGTPPGGPPEGGGPSGPSQAPGGGEGAGVAPSLPQGEAPATAGASLSERLQATADAAMQRIKDRGSLSGTKANAMPDPADLADVAIWGAAKLAHGTLKFGTWSKEMLADFGDGIKPHLEDLFKQAQKAFARHVDTTESKLANTKQLLKLLRDGEEGKDWYTKTHAELVDMFGPDAPIMEKFLSATSPNNTVAGNVTQALKAYRQWRLGQEFQGFLPAHMDALNKIAAGEDFGGLKVHSFLANLAGDPEAVTVDRWIRRAFKFPKDTITDNQYKFMDYRLTQIARRTGMEPRQVQAAIWKAVKEADERGSNTTSEPFEALLPKRLAADTQMQELIRQAKAGESAPARP